MTIKKQFISLISVIVAIPLICILFICTFHYAHQNERLLLNGYKDIKRYDGLHLTQEGLDELYSVLKNLPPKTEGLLISEESKIILSSIEEIPADRYVIPEELFSYINNSSDRYFYQFSRPVISNKRMLIITRVDRTRKAPRKPENLLTKSMMVLISLVVLCIILTITIAKNVFNSILHLEKCTEQIADGNLNIKITTSNKTIKKNEITALSESLEKMRLALVDNQNRRNRFIMGISHDLRTPVAVIKGYTEALRDGVITEKSELENALSLIDSKSNQLEEMITTLLDFLKLNEFELKKDFQETSINSLINEFVKEAEITSTIFKRRFSSDIKLSEEITLPANRLLINRALENLYSNAIRYTKDEDLIHIRAFIQTAEKNQIVIEIQDTGIGIAEEEIDHIFDIFYKATNSRREEGMGIGLSVVKSIIETHGWTIEVSSKVNEGTCFTIKIPY